MFDFQSESSDSSIDSYRLRRSRAMILHALKNPLVVGAVAAASPRLARDVVSHVEPGCNVVVELGAGTGVITQALLQQRSNRHGVVAIEIDPQLADIARTRLGAAANILVGDALQLESYFDESQVDCIICSLPLTLLSSQDLDALLTGARSVLKSDGRFVFYLYRMGFWRHRYHRVIEKVRCHFPQIRENRTVWRNLPPARVIVCH